MINTYSLSTDGDKKLSENFTVCEFACSNGADEVKIDSKLVEYLQNIRTHFKKPINITSAYRPEPYNSSIGGAYGSYHTLGRACDLYIKGVKVDEIAKYAESIGVLGIGCYHDDLFVHIDTRTEKFYWYNQTCTGTNTFGGAVIADKQKKIKVIQNWLNRHFGTKTTVNGYYKSATKKAIIKAAEGMCGLKRTGKLSEELLQKFPVLKQGAKSAYVALVQAILIGQGYDLTFDGTYGNKTAEAVKKYQQKNSLTADGVCGETTINKLLG